ISGVARDIELRQHARRDSALLMIREKTDQLPAQTDRIVAAAANAVASAWVAKATAAAASAAARAAIIREAGVALDAVRLVVDGSAGVRPADTEMSGRATTSSDRRMPPMFDAAFLNELPDLSPPRLVTAPRHILAERRLSDIRAPLRDDLDRYAARLYAWGQQALMEMPDEASAAESGIGVSGPSAAAGTNASPETAILADIDALIDLPTVSYQSVSDDSLGC
ncbi:MAG: hypothetical protein ABI026_03665, partial [Gemmatimonadaceae bacterium]